MVTSHVTEGAPGTWFGIIVLEHGSWFSGPGKDILVKGHYSNNDIIIVGKTFFFFFEDGSWFLAGPS